MGKQTKALPAKGTIAEKNMTPTKSKSVSKSPLAAKKTGSRLKEPSKVITTTSEQIKVTAPEVEAAKVESEAFICNICGGTKFKAGPSGRLSMSNLPPICIGCGSNERHRVFRSMFDDFRGPNFKALSCLSFSKDRSYAGGWFRSVQYAGPGATPAIDIQDLPMADASIDVLICNNILAAIKNYEQGLEQIARVMSSRGFAFITFPNPHYNKVTKDWGHPKVEHGGNYRTFGEDIEAKIPLLLPNLGIVRLVSEDPVTKTQDRAYLISKNFEFLAGIGERGMKIRFLQF